MAALVLLKESISFDLPSGEQVNLREGRVFPDDHPYVKGREQFFEPAADAAARVPGAAVAVETATAVPGARRSVTRRNGDTVEV